MSVHNWHQFGDVLVAMAEMKLLNHNQNYSVKMKGWHCPRAKETMMFAASRCSLFQSFKPWFHYQTILWCCTLLFLIRHAYSWWYQRVLTAILLFTKPCLDLKKHYPLIFPQAKVEDMVMFMFMQFPYES